MPKPKVDPAILELLLKNNPDSNDSEDESYSDFTESEDSLKKNNRNTSRNKKRKLIADVEMEDEDYKEPGSDYFVKDSSKLKSGIANHILDELTDEQAEALEPQIKKGINDAFILFKNLVEERFNDILDLEATSNLWKLGLGPKQISKYETQIKELRDSIKEEHITIQKILEAKLDKKTKTNLLKMFDTMQKFDKTSLEYSNIESTMSSLIEAANKSSLSTEDVEKLNEHEKKLKTMTVANSSLRMRILNAPIDEKRKAVIYEKYLTLENTPEDSNTAACIEEWIEEALKTPFTALKPNMTTTASPGECLLQIKKEFESKMSDMDIVLESLLTAFNNRLNNPNASNLVISFLGSPGTGKTYCGKTIADALGMPFHQISLGGILDSSILDGQHTGWLGSSPGRFVKALQDMGVINGVLFLDEIDKLGESTAGLQVQYSLLHSIDPTQNHQFHDHYLGPKLPIDLSKCLIICALNKTEGLDPALLNRLDIIKLPDYTPDQKKNILRKHLFPNALTDAALTTAEIQLTDPGCDEIYKLVTEKNSTKEGGVRGMRSCIKTIINKLSLLLRITPEEQAALKLSFTIPELPCTPGHQRKLPIQVTPEIARTLYNVRGDKNASFQHMYL